MARHAIPRPPGPTPAGRLLIAALIASALFIMYLTGVFMHSGGKHPAPDLVTPSVSASQGAKQ